MKYIFIICLMLFASCNSDSKKKIQTQKHALPHSNISLKDTSIYTVFQYDTNEHKNYFDKVLKPSTLTDPELLIIENLIGEQVSKYNKAKSIQSGEYKKKEPNVNFYSNAINDPRKYRKQLIAIINAKGEKEVWVNCFCSDEPYWKKEIVIVNDGGSCYFSLKINLTLKKVLHFGVNGVA